MAVKSVCGIIIISDKPEKLSDFYARTLGLEFEREDHGGLAPHFGVDIGNVHFGIHPPENFSKEKSASKSSNTIIAFDVNSLSDCQKQLESNGSQCTETAHDEGFGMVARYADPEGNSFEIVELKYQFAKS